MAQFRYLFVVLMAGLAACSNSPNTPAPLLAVEVVAPQPAAETGSDARYPVVFVRDREADLGFRIGGTVTSVPVRIGDRIGRGGVVARIDGTAQTAALTRSDAEIDRLSRIVARNRVLVGAGAVAPADAEDARTALTAALAARSAARFDANAATIRMPFDGVVLSRESESGAVVGPGQRIARVADLRSPLLARAQFPASLAAGLRVGQSVNVRANGTATDSVGRILRIGSASDPATGTVTVDIAMPNDARLVLGTTGSAAIMGSATIGGATLPIEALLDSNRGVGHVFVALGKNPVARRVQVRVSGLGGERIVVDGLPSDARVITAGAGFVTDGQPVAVTRR